MSNGISNLYEFGSFRFDAESKILWRGEEMIPLPPKALEVFSLLIENEGRLVSKQEILSTVWADTFVEEGVLTQNIYKLRGALGKDENGKQFIENIARRGYRFTAPLKISKPETIKSEIGAQKKENFFAETIDDSSVAAPEPDLYAASEIQPENNAAANGAIRNFRADTAVNDYHSRSPAKKIIYVAAGILLFFALGFGIYQFIGRDEEKKVEVKPAPIEQLRFQRLTDSGDVVFPTISPNGEMLAYVRLEEEEGSVWVKQIAADNAVRILPSSNKGYRSLTFSPDGKILYFRQEPDGSPIFQTSILGGTPKKVAENVWSDFGISPDGQQIAFIRRDSERKRHLLIVSKLDGSGERELSVKNAPADYRSPPAFSPDGSKIIVASGIQAQSFPKLLTINTSDGAETELKIPRWRAIQRALWMPNGKNLIISARDAKEPYSQLWLLSYPGDEIRRLTNDLEAYFWISMSADGKMIVTRQQKIFSHLWLLPDGDLKKAKQLTSGGRNLDGYVGLTWTPDDKIIFSAFSNNITDLYMIDMNGGNRIQLTANSGQDNNFPSVSRDGRFIVFTSNRTGTTQIWRMDIDGGNQKQLTFVEDPERIQSPALSPDGAEVFFIKRGSGPAAIWKIPIDGGEPVQVSRLKNATPEGFVSISPDGKKLAYHHIADRTEAVRESQIFRIGVLPIQGDAEPQIFDLPMRRPFVQWTSDSVFDYTSGIFNTSSILRQSTSGGASQKLLDFPDRVFNFAWSNDGKNLVVARGKQHGDALLITNLP
jgi:Tol biopolymer transport system component/DNA-binding winged helix-turn-helix (wHTH) protein